MSIAHLYPPGSRLSDELRTFTVEDYDRMVEAGLFRRDEAVELIDGLVYEKHSDSLLPRRFTVDEYYKLAEVGILGPDERVELIDGVIYRMSPIGSPHAACVDALATFFHARLAGRVHVRVQQPIRLPNRTEPQPDVALLHLRQDRYRNSHPRPEEIHLLVEVMATSALRDRGQKLTAYAKAGIVELWLIDLEDELVHVHREPRGAVYTRVEEFLRGQSVAPAAFPDAALALDDLFG
jgi:Uma2 family endonuclease